MLETTRLHIRPFRSDEVGALIELRADPDVSRYLGGATMQSPEAIKQRFEFYLSCYESHGFGMSAVIRKTDGVMIGWGGLQPLGETGEIEVGYGFAKRFWGCGYATEMAAAWLRYGFEQRGLDHIVAVAEPENTGSWRVMEKLGMIYRGREQHYKLECVVYTITPEQFRAANPNTTREHDESRFDEREA